MKTFLFQRNPAQLFCLPKILNDCNVSIVNPDEILSAGSAMFAGSKNNTDLENKFSGTVKLMVSLPK